MKYRCLLLLIFLRLPLAAQDSLVIEDNLIRSFRRVIQLSENGDPDDSLYIANDHFQSLLLQYTSNQPRTLNFNFSRLKLEGLSIKSSQDGNVRIYTWDSRTGGTMRFFRNVFQYKYAEKVLSKTFEDYSRTVDTHDGSYYGIDQVSDGRSVYYVTRSVSVGSSAVFYYSVKVFSIVNGSLIENAKIIKTKSGLVGEVGYEVDLVTMRKRLDYYPKFQDLSIKFDAKSKTFSFPLITEDGFLAEKMIRYRFDGKVFRRI